VRGNRASRRAGARARVLGLALLGSSARSTAAEPARFSYFAPADCPDEQDFIERVRERSVHERPATGDELALSFVVTLSRDAEGVLGRVEFSDRDGTPVSRAVRGATCDEVASSIALVTALAIDARAEPPPLVRTPSSSAANEPAPLTPPPTPTRAAAPGAPERSTTTGFFTAGFGAGFQSAVGPTGGATLEAFLAAASGPRGISLRLTAFHWLASGSHDGREAEFRVWGGRVDGCPLAFERSGVFVTPCVGFGAGALRASGVRSANLPKPDHASIAWFDGALLGRAGVVFGEFVVLEAEAGLLLPLVRKEFGFSLPEPRSTLYAVPPLAAGVSVHGGVRFP
jgi:hypothetical protein